MLACSADVPYEAIYWLMLRNNINSLRNCQQTVNIYEVPITEGHIQVTNMFEVAA